MRPKIFRTIRVLACTLPIAVLAACGSGSGAAKVVTITVPPSSPASTSSGSGSAQPGASSAAGSPTAQTKLPGTCDSLLPDYQISQALGGRQLAGKDDFVVGEPEKDIGRLAYLNCQYGVTGTGDAAAAKVEIGVSLYTDQAKAAARIRATVADYKAHGATSADAVVGGSTGTLLTGGTGAEYDQPLLVTSAGQRTVAVTIDDSVATGAKVSTTTRTLATLALRVTAK